MYMICTEITDIRRIHAPAGSFYAAEAARALRLPPVAAVRAGLAPYTDRGDVDRLLAAVRDIAAAAAAAGPAAGRAAL